MRIALLTNISRGDVDPLVALGRGLRNAGHDIRIATYARYEATIRHHGKDNLPRVNALIRTALKQSGQRGIILTGPGGLQQQDFSDDDIFVMAGAPHSWLMPRTAAVVHNGGVGTTAAALRAGVPSIVIPYFFDQPLWGERVFASGAGPQPIPYKKLSAERLTTAIRQAVHDPQMRQQAAALSAQIRREDGVGEAVALVNRYLQE